MQTKSELVRYVNTPYLCTLFTSCDMPSKRWLTNIGSRNRHSSYKTVSKYMRVSRSLTHVDTTQPSAAQIFSTRSISGGFVGHYICKIASLFKFAVKNLHLVFHSHSNDFYRKRLIDDIMEQFHWSE